MPGHSTGAHQSSRHHKKHTSSSARADGYRHDRTISRDSTASQESHKDHHHHGEQHAPEHHHADHPRHQEAKHGRRGGGHQQRNVANGRGSETLGFIPGSADNAPSGRRSCGSCASMGWSGCKALICCVLTCGFYGSREPCLPVNESSTDHPSKAGSEGHVSNGMMALSNPTCGVPVEARPPSKPSKLPASDSFRYQDVRIAGKTVSIFPTQQQASHVTRASRATTTNPTGTGTQRPVSNTSLYSREELDLDDLSDAGTDIDSLITKKLLELYALHQIDQLAKCTSDSSFSRKTNEISELIYSIAQDYNLEEQEAECKLVHGVIRISTRKGKRSKGGPPPAPLQQAPPPGQRANGRSDGTLPDSGNETMTNTFMSSDMPEVKVSEQTSSDELARKMRHYSGRTYSSTATAYSPYHHETETNSSGAPLLDVL